MFLAHRHVYICVDVNNMICRLIIAKKYDIALFKVFYKAVFIVPLHSNPPRRLFV